MQEEEEADVVDDVIADNQSGNLGRKIRILEYSARN